MLQYLRAWFHYAWYALGACVASLMWQTGHPGVRQAFLGPQAH
jgi:hypothetical protein